MRPDLGPEGGEGAGAVVLAVPQDHAPVKSGVPRPAGGHDLQLCRLEIFFADPVLLFQDLQEHAFYRILFFFAAFFILLPGQRIRVDPDRLARDDQVERLSFNGLGCRLFHLLLGKMDQQVGHKKYRIIVIFSHAQYHCLPALFDDDAVNSQRDRGKLVFFDPSVVVGVQIGDAAVLIERILFDVEPGGIDMRTQNVHAAFKGLCADLEKDHGFVHPHAVDLISGR